MALSLISINVEFDKHYDTVLPFLEKEAADVVCVQELFERDIARFEAVCGPLVAFAPDALHHEDASEILGSALFSRLPATNVTEHYYVGSRETVRQDDGKSDVGTHSLVAADIGSEGYRIATTHFMWTRDGQSTPEQLRTLDTLFGVLDSLNAFVLAGDFNAPRGNETFTRLASRYTDNIPRSYETSIDVEKHKTRDIPEARARVSKYMVDGLFTTPEYTAKDVRLEFGLSDHAAIIATIEKAA
ncbi:MAG TPA: endonuclease/exonuclease/phosphatase family protein [Candidatus Paceibacterota bacterium]|nr:endonuclease/exonuclease/phosphatase family protein [Candidatus Paceibacterota bacterium]